MSLTNIAKRRGPNMDPGGTPKNNGFYLDKYLPCITCTFQLKR